MSFAGVKKVRLVPPALRSAIAWPKERVAQLAKLAGEKLSARQIGLKLGCSRNAVIGQAKRHDIPLGVAPGGGHARGLPRRMSETREHVKVAQPTKPASPKATPAEPESLRITLFDVRDPQCRWPHGDPDRLETFHCCGHACDEGDVYCPHHMQRARGPATVRAA